MHYKEGLGSSASACPIVIVHSPNPNKKNVDSKAAKRSYYADNLAFTIDEEALLTKSIPDIYKPLSELVTENENGNVSSTKVVLSKQHIFGAILCGVLLTLAYLWVHVHYVQPFVNELVDQMPVSSSLLSKALPAKVPPRFLHLTTSHPPVHQTTWQVDYDLPAGIPVVTMNAREMGDELPTSCPHENFALSLYLEDSNSQLAENWFKVCGKNVAYFRIEGDPNPKDVDRLLVYLRNTHYLPLKARLHVGKGGNILSNPDYIKTKNSDQIIRSLEISGYVTPKTMEELVEVVPYTEELTIKGDEVCKSLKKSLRNSGTCGEDGRYKLTWNILQKLHIFQTQECRGMYDLIYSCWNMPSLEIVQVRQSMISGVNSNFINGILDKYRITKVDFADNVCFDDTLKSYPFMCQASG